MNSAPRTFVLLIFTLACSPTNPAPVGGPKDASGGDAPGVDKPGTSDVSSPNPQDATVAPMDASPESVPDVAAPMADAAMPPADADASASDASGDRPGDGGPRPDAGPVTGARWMISGCDQAAIIYPRIDSNNGRFPPGSCPPPETLKPVCPGNSKIAVVTATASNFETAFPHPPAYAIDEHMTTRWSTNPGPTGWIMLDLGAEKTFQRLYLAWELAHGSGYDIVVSNDAQTWTTLAMVRGGDGYQDVLDVDGKGRYVRMNGITRGSTGTVPQCCAPPGTLHGYSLFDFTVCGESQ